MRGILMPRNKACLGNQRHQRTGQGWTRFVQEAAICNHHFQKTVQDSEENVLKNMILTLNYGRGVAAIKKATHRHNSKNLSGPSGMN